MLSFLRLNIIKITFFSCIFIINRYASNELTAVAPARFPQAALRFKTIKIHDRYNAEPAIHDVALLELTPPIEIDQYVATIELLSEGPPPLTIVNAIFGFPTYKALAKTGVCPPDLFCSTVALLDVNLVCVS